MEKAKERRKEWTVLALALVSLTTAAVACSREPSAVSRLELLGAVAICIVLVISLRNSYLPEVADAAPQEITPEIRRQRRTWFLRCAVTGILLGSVAVYLAGFPAHQAAAAFLLGTAIVVPILQRQFRKNDEVAVHEPAVSQPAALEHV